MHYKKSVFRNLAMVTQLGLYMLTPVFLCVFAGHMIDSHFGTKSILIFTIIGVISGALSAYKMVMRTLKSEEQEDKEEKRKRKQKLNYKTVSRPKTPHKIYSSKNRDEKEKTL